MLNANIRHSAPLFRQEERGVVMMVALVVLVVMTLAGIALMRSMDTTNLIAGNMAFKQSATHSSDTGVEAALSWLEKNNAADYLYTDKKTVGYFAATLSNADLKFGEQFWSQLEGAGVCHLPMIGGVCSASPVVNGAGNQVSYMIHRLCKNEGNRTDAASGCSVVTGTIVVSGNSEGAGEETLTGITTSSYYRITVRVVGPRNAISYIQAIVSM